jgi:alkanesulfonate monooxygenase SsuD/methylene tetrahydromethanopterin reductase-like flavin-dependent oxidoreductase (luciferase family)
MIEGQEGVSWEHWVALAEAAERAGLEALFRSDHYLWIVRGGSAGSLDAWATLAALAARTERLRLGTLVSPVTFRPAPVLAKSVATVDDISGGRVELGIGAGWYEAEHAAYGFPFPPLGDRMRELERQLATIHEHWSPESPAWPKPVQQPRPPIIVGGSAKPRGVAIAVHYADEYNTVSVVPDEAGRRHDAVAEACEQAGREPLRFSVMTTGVVGSNEGEVRDRLRRLAEHTGNGPGEAAVVGTVEQAAERLREYESAGVDRIMLQHLLHEEVEMVELLGELDRAVR